MRLRPLKAFLIIPALYVMLGVLLIAPARVAHADEVQLKADHPERYTVQKGDTLWDIASRFLNSPWLWAKVWKGNEQIKNPHLIYPGDVIVMRWVDGKPELSVLRNEKLPLSEAPTEPGSTVAETPDEPLPPLSTGSTGRTEKLKPGIHGELLSAAIPTIPPDAIMPFLTFPLAVGEKELTNAGYVTIGLDDRIALGDQSEFYARDVKGDDDYFYIFRPGRPIRHPETKELLGYEAIYLGDAKRLESGDPAKMIVTRVKQEILPTDRLLAAPSHVPLPYYYPSAPPKEVNGRIASALDAVAEIGTYGIVAITLGKREGIQEGHVLRVMRHVGTRRDPVKGGNYKIPDEESGLVMVFRVYEKLSYALVMRATRPVHVLDAVVTP
jgi:hypothetical protein